MTSSARTASGVEVELRYRWDVDDGINEGWIVHVIEAAVDGAPAGYIKLSYVPKEQQEALFPDPFAYALERTGSFHSIRRLLEERPESEWTEKDLFRAIEDSYRYVGAQMYDELRSLDRDQLQERWQERKRFLKDEYRRRFREFCEFHVDKPLVDFIRVYGPDETRYYRGSDREAFPASGIDFRRQGIGTLLYQAAAVWMAEHGMCLWASGVQSPDAQHAWEKLASLHELGSVPAPKGSERKQRRFLDGTQIQLGVDLPVALSDLEAPSDGEIAAGAVLDVPLSVLD